jgi:hypothetical protein
MIMTVTKIYHSREDLIAKLHKEADRIQNKDRDTDCRKMIDVINTIEDPFEDMLDGVWDILDAEDADEEAYARRTMIEKWALVQANLSKLAWVMRIDGNEAYNRMINALETGDAVDMRGL